MDNDEKLARLLSRTAMGNENDISPATGKPLWMICLMAARKYLSEIQVTPAVAEPASVAPPEPPPTTPKGVVLSRGEAKLVLDAAKSALRYVPARIGKSKAPHPCATALQSVKSLMEDKLK